MLRPRSVVAVYTGLALTAIIIGAARGDPDLYREEGISTSLRLLTSPLAGLAIGLAVVLLSRVAVLRLAWAQRLHGEFRAALTPITGREIALLATASAVGEELLFRGALQPWLGLVPQALLFALAHVGPALRFLPWTVCALGMGLLLGGLFAWTGDLGGPIVAHFTINYLNLRHVARVKLPPVQ